jgi:hypothetical protein
MTQRPPLRPVIQTQRFDSVARIIANPPPKWLAEKLAQFSPFIVTETTSDEADVLDEKIVEMHDAAVTLIKYLPGINVGGSLLGMLASRDVTTALEVLPRIKKGLARLTRSPRTGRRHDVPREFCAAVIVEAWKLLHDGSVEPQSSEVLEACAAYWEACGHKERDAKNWWRDTDRAVSKPNEVVRRLLRPQN